MKSSLRDEETKTITITPKYDENLNRYRIGIRPARKITCRFIINSIRNIYLTKSIMTLLGQLVQVDNAEFELVGPRGSGHINQIKMESC